MKLRSIVALIVLLALPALASGQLKSIRNGIFAYEAGKYDVAIKELSTGLKTPEEAKENLIAKGYLRLALSYIRISDPNIGGLLFPTFKDSATAFSMKAHLALQEAIKRKADTEFKADVDEAKTSVGALLYNAANKLNSEEKYAEAIEHSIAAEQYLVNQWYIYGSRAPMYLQVKDTASAMKAYEKTVEVFWPDTAAVNQYKDQMQGIYVTLSAIYITYAKDNAKAKKLLEQGLAKFPTEATLNKQYMYVMQQPEYKDEALNYYRSSIEKDPSDVASLLGLAQLLEESDPQASIAYYEKVIALNPDDSDVLLRANYNLGGIYANKAAAISKKAQELNNQAKLSNEDVKQIEIYAADTKVLLDKALPYYKNAVAIAPEECAPISALAKIYTYLEMAAEAEEASEKAKQICG